MSQKVRENRLRRMAERQGLRLTKSRRRDPRAIDYGTWRLTGDAGEVLATRDLDDVERHLTGDDR